MKVVQILMVVLVMLGLCGAPHAAQSAKKLAVMATKVTQIDNSYGYMLTEILTNALHKYGHFDVMGGSDIEALLGFEKQKELLGCDDLTCMAEIGGALGTDLLLVSSVGMMGEIYVLNLKLINIKEIKVENRVLKTLQGQEKQLIAAMEDCVKELLGLVQPQSVAGQAQPKQPEIKQLEKAQASQSVATPQAKERQVEAFRKSQSKQGRKKTETIASKTRLGLSVGGGISWSSAIYHDVSTAVNNLYSLNDQDNTGAHYSFVNAYYHNAWLEADFDGVLSLADEDNSMYSLRMAYRINAHWSIGAAYLSYADNRLQDKELDDFVNDIGDLTNMIGIGDQPSLTISLQNILIGISYWPTDNLRGSFYMGVVIDGKGSVVSRPGLEDISWNSIEFEPQIQSIPAMYIGLDYFMNNGFTIKYYLYAASAWDKISGDDYEGASLEFTSFVSGIAVGYSFSSLFDW